MVKLEMLTYMGASLAKTILVRLKMVIKLMVGRLTYILMVSRFQFMFIPIKTAFIMNPNK